MACLAACFDKAGDVDEPVIPVAGFVAEQHHWDSAGDEWRKVTGADDFHMSDLAPAQKNAALAALVPIANRHFRVPIATGVHTGAFKTARLGDAKRRVGDPYRLCCLNCIIAVSEWAQEENEAPVDLVFDKDGKFYNETSQLYDFATRNLYLREKYKIGSMTPSDRDRTRGIQIADALAHALFSFHRKRMENPSLSMGPQLTALVGNMPKNGWLFTEAQEVEH